MGLWVLFGKDGLLFNVQCSKPFAGTTREGIGIGSTRAELIKAFGNPSQARQLGQGAENLWFATQKISCTLENDRITRLVVHLDLFL